MSEVTYDALVKRIAKLRETIEQARQCIDADDVIGAHAILVAALGEDNV